MPSPVGPYMAARKAALLGDAALLAAMELPAQPNVYTEVPTNAAVPYVVLGLVQLLSLTDENEGCASEAELSDTIDLWSKKSPLDGGVQAVAMGDAVLDALSLALAVAGWDVVERVVERADYVTDPDQSTHGTIVINWQLTRDVS